MTRLVEFLDDLDADLADNGVLDGYAGATAYRVCGLFWFQGWNEQFDDQPYTAAQMQAEYADNLCDLIYSVRAADPRIPENLGLIVGESSDQNAGHQRRPARRGRRPSTARSQTRPPTSTPRGRRGSTMATTC